MQQFNKLVRDKIPNIILKNGEIPVYEIIEDDIFLEELCNKLLEESNEFIKDKSIEELADIYEVFIAILKLKGIDLSEVQRVASAKVLKRGSFDKKIYLKYVE